MDELSRETNYGDGVIVPVDPQDEAESQEEWTTLDERVAEARKALADVVRVLNSEDIRDRRRKHLQNLRALGTARQVIELAVTESVKGTREVSNQEYWSNWDLTTWEEIGKALGVTKQAAQGRYGKKN